VRMVAAGMEVFVRGVEVKRIGYLAHLTRHLARPFLARSRWFALVCARFSGTPPRPSFRPRASALAAKA
jgi:hypothetical protein